MTDTRATPPIRARAARLAAGPIRVLAAAFVAFLPCAGHCPAQSGNPVYVDDSPAAADGIERAEDLALSGNRDEAVRVLQRLLEVEGDRLIRAGVDPDTFISVRERIHRALLEDARLLDAYRRIESPAAERDLAGRGAAAVERSRLLTPSGFEAALREAQRHLEAGAFEAARQTLEQLETHPDRTGAAARDAAELLTTVSRYLGRPEVREYARRWREQAGLPPLEEGGAAVIAPPPAIRPLSAFAPGPEIDLLNMVSKPLSTEPLSVEPAIAPDDGPQAASPEEDVPRSARLLHILPTVVGDTIYVNDSQSITAWDRFTLELKWRVDFSPVGASRRNGAYNVGVRAIEDLNTISIFDSWLFAVTGVAFQGAREGDMRVHALDARSGARRWSTEVASLDPALQEASVRGPVMVDQGRAIITTVTKSKLRRLLGVHLVALDLATGRLAWHRLLASTGSLPYAYGAQVTDGGALDRGVVYATDRLGFVSAVESASGRIRWVRRLSSDPAPSVIPNTWELSPPVIAAGRVYIIAPDQRSILALSPESGATVAERPISDFNHRPRYLLAHGGALIAVGESAVQAISLSDFANPGASVRTLLTAPPSGLRGRASVSGGRVLAPTARGVLAADIDALSAEGVSVVSLDSPGNLLALDSQLLVVDDAAIHTYLIWDVAERILTDRVRADPTDAAPAAIFAELAHRAGRTDRILPAIDSALRAIEAAPATPRNQSARRRLFQAAMGMVDPGPQARIDAPLDRAIVTQMHERLERLAATPEERVRRLMALGAFHEAGDAAALAVEAYQAVLDDQALSSCVVVRHGASFDAETEATRRLQRVVRQFGRSAYDRYEREADVALAAASGGLDPETFAAIARRYPVSRAAARAWLEASSAYAARGRAPGAVYALERSLRVAEEALDPSDPMLGEIAGRLVQGLARSDRVAAAGATLARVLDRWPAIRLTDSGETLDATALSASISARLATLQRRPRVGLALAQDAQFLAAWTLVRPLLDEPSAASAEFIVLRNDTEGRLGLYGVDGGGGVKQLWTIPATDDAAFLRLEDTAVYVSRSSPQGVTVSRLDLATGRVVWMTPPLRKMFPLDVEIERRLGVDGAVRPSTIETPLAGRRPLTEALVTIDGRTLALVERTGRAAAIDLDSGQTLWTRTDAARAVYDAVASAGQLVVAGASAEDRDGAARAGNGPAPALVTLDIRSGRTIHTLPAESGQLRWVRMSPEGLLVVGSEEAVTAYDLFQGRTRWISAAQAARQSLDAWLFPGRAIILTARASLFQIETDDGASGDDALDMMDRAGSTLGGVDAIAVGDNAIFATPAGVLLYDRGGALIGVDHRRRESQMLVSQFSKDHVVSVDRQPASGEGEQPELFDVKFFTLASCALAQQRQVTLGASPTAIGLIDGRVLISAGEATVVIDAAEE